MWLFTSEAQFVDDKEKIWHSKRFACAFCTASISSVFRTQSNPQHALDKGRPIHTFVTLQWYNDMPIQLSSATLQDRVPEKCIVLCSSPGIINPVICGYTKCFVPPAWDSGFWYCFFLTISSRIPLSARNEGDKWLSANDSLLFCGTLQRSYHWRSCRWCWTSIRPQISCAGWHFPIRQH